MICDCDGNGMAFASPHEFMFQTHELNHPPSILPSCPPQDFHGAQTRRSMSFSGIGSKWDHQEMQVEDDMSDDDDGGSNSQVVLGEKKKRLGMEQVKALEKSFHELGNKLDPERKLQLARALNLQPRQVAIWFQNRRARWKTKQLEKDYDLLKREFESLKADNGALKSHNNKLHAELLALKGIESNGIGPINLNKEIEGSIESSLDTYKHIFHSSTGATSSVTHLLQSSSRSDLQCRKIDQTVPDESFCNMFSSIEDQPSFWPWPEQQHIH
ncbi:unnamed protein product [Camellia sinensis]